jgi:hypothetical protein
MTTDTSQPTAPIAVGVVIVSYNTRALLHDCLHSLTACQVPLRVVVVDNASTDGSAAMVRTQFPHVHLLALATNHGFAGGNNRGLRALGYGGPAPGLAPPDYVLLLNPDTIVHAAALETLVAFLQEHPRVGVAAPRLLNADGSLQAAAFRFPTLSMSLLDMFPPGEVLPGRLYGSWWHGRYPQETPHTTQPFAIDHPLGACLLVRRAVVDQVGLLDEGYFMYSEVIDWCWRIRQAHWAIWQVPAARVTHLGGAATGPVRWRMLVELHRSRIRFFQQHYRPGFLRAHRLLTRAGMLRATLRDWLAYRRGQLSQADLRARLLAYGLVSRL